VNAQSERSRIAALAAAMAMVGGCPCERSQPQIDQRTCSPNDHAADRVLRTNVQYCYGAPSNDPLIICFTCTQRYYGMSITCADERITNPFRQTKCMAWRNNWVIN